MRAVLILLLVVSFTSCVSESTYDSVVQERNSISQERDALKHELNDIKFSAPSLLKDGNRFYEAKDFVHAREAYTKLIQDFSDRPEGAEAKNLLVRLSEDEAWTESLASDKVEMTEQYLSKYPSGRYIAQANLRLAELRAKAEGFEYEMASEKNSSSAWRHFLELYPNRDDEKSIRRKIIQLEVDEILAGEHGTLPSSVPTSYGSSGQSSVEISNDTGYPLTIRYSGPDVQSIEIPVAGTRTVSLSSGNYRVAASANGLYYGGSEYLHGNYSSKFYISSTRSTYSTYSSPYNSY